jgi:hypothetical protein
MATVSKSTMPRKQPNLSRSGKVRIFGFSVDKLIELRDKAQRPRDKHKFNARLISLASK